MPETYISYIRLFVNQPYSIKKEEIKLPKCVQDMNFYVENKESENKNKKVHKTLNSSELSKIIRYKTTGYEITGYKGFLGGSVVKNPSANTRDTGLISWSGRSPREGNGNPLQYSCLGNPMDRGAWQAPVHRVTEELYMT